MNLRNMGEIDNVSGVGEVGNFICGDIMKIFLDIDGDVIKDVKFKIFGCGLVIVSFFMVIEMIKGKIIKDVLEFINKVVVEVLDGLLLVKMYCLVLVE